MARRDKYEDGAANLHNDESWNARLEDARARRAEALREKELLNTEASARKKPWEQEAASAKPVAPILQERGPNDDAVDFADRVDAIRHTAQNAPEPDNHDAIQQAEDDVPKQARDAAASLLPRPVEELPDDAPDPTEVLILSRQYAAALDAYEKSAATPEAETATVDPETAHRYAAALASIEGSDGADVVDLPTRSDNVAELDVYPGADRELAQHYAAVLATLPEPEYGKDKLSVAAGGRRLFMLSSLLLVVGLLTLPWIPAQPVVNGPEAASTPSPGLQPAIGVRQSLQDVFAVAVPLVPRVAPAGPELPVGGVPARGAQIVAAPAGLLSPPQALSAPVTAWSEVAPVDPIQTFANLHDPLIADRTFVAGLSPDVTAPAAAVIRPNRVADKQPDFRNILTEVRPLDLESAAPISGTITVTALDTEDTFDALAAAIAEDVARALRR